MENSPLVSLLSTKLSATTMMRMPKAIAQACGFHDTSYLMTLFQRKVGMTMRAWRRQSRIPG